LISVFYIVGCFVGGWLKSMVIVEPVARLSPDATDRHV
jgi:hypothetical protein